MARQAKRVDENGRLHCADHPVVSTPTGDEHWYWHGLRHRGDGLPALIRSNGSREFWVYGKLSRIEGPAVEWPDGYVEYWIDGVAYASRAEFEVAAVLAPPGEKEKPEKAVRTKGMPVVVFCRELEATSVVAGPCAKQRVIAEITTLSGEKFFGENLCANPQEVCPRADMPTGVGYHLCREICQKICHAEIAAIAAAGEKARGATLILHGHTYACDDCKAAAAHAGIVAIEIAAPMANDRAMASICEKNK